LIQRDETTAEKLPKLLYCKLPPAIKVWSTDRVMLSWQRDAIGLALMCVAFWAPNATAHPLPPFLSLWAMLLKSNELDMFSCLA
jgi:hypothetical protein